MKIISNSKNNEKQFSHVRAGDVFKYKNDFYVKVAKYYEQGYTVTKLMGPVASFYGACLVTGTIYVVVFPNATVLIDGVENENKMDKTT